MFAKRVTRTVSCQKTIMPKAYLKYLVPIGRGIRHNAMTRAAVGLPSNDYEAQFLERFGTNPNTDYDNNNNYYYNYNYHYHYNFNYCNYYYYNYHKYYNDNNNKNNNDNDNDNNNT